LWNIEYGKQFVKQYKQLSSVLQKKTDSVLCELSKSENPAMLGKYEQNLRVYAYALDKSNRIIFTINFADNKIELRRVGTTKKPTKAK
jgi:mRNA-degrading endonuclease RelE of RelBE toxin-antitoxin system